MSPKLRCLPRRCRKTVRIERKVALPKELGSHKAAACCDRELHPYCLARRRVVLAPGLALRLSILGHASPRVNVLGFLLSCRTSLSA